MNFLSVKQRRGPLAGLVISLFTYSTATAAEAPDVPPACPDPAIAPVRVSRPDSSGQPLWLDARSFKARVPDSAEASGNVELRRGDQLFGTELLQYFPDGQLVRIPGPISYRDPQIALAADSAVYSFLRNEGEMSGVQYQLVGATARGTAEHMQLATQDRSLLQGLRFTTCPGEEPEWLLTADELELRHDEGIGIARGAKLEFMDVPFLYLPWISFPIDDRRKSGFLYPGFGNANDNGFEVSIPYYWNVAPNRDATLTPRYFTDRGFMLTGELRNLTPRSGSVLEFDYLFDDKVTQRTRNHYTLRHRTAINRKWNSTVVVDRVSDDQYFQDFGHSLAQTARQFLHSRAGIHGGGRYWTFSLLADDFQVIDESVSATSEPYRRLPRLAYSIERPLSVRGLQFGFDSEVVNFDRDVGVTGVRTDLYPRLEWGMARYWGFLRGGVGYRYTSYNLDLNGAASDSSPDRGTEIVTLDSGMYFERSLPSGNVQTLEPRVFYLYVPYEDQDDLPDFDTGEFTFSFAQLFHTNRFTGADRQSDANRLTLALGTRSVDPRSGQDRWSLQLGQIFYFDDRRVRLGDQAMPLDINTSPFVAEFNWHPFTRFTGRIGLQWNWEDRDLDLGTLGVDYRSKSGSRLGFEYRYRRDRLDQFDLRYLWSVNERWRIISRLKYSLEESDLLEAQAGIEYESCCWALRLISRRYLRSRDGDERDTIYLVLSLKGLGRFGRQPLPLFYDEAE